MQKDKSIDASAAEDLDDDAIEKFANKQAFVVVLGDIGRSPRMCNHAVSLAAAGFDVTFVGYDGSNLSQQVRHSHKIQISTLPTCPRWMPRPLKAIWQFITLFCSLPWITGPDVILMQNPPTIPTVVVAYVYACLHRHTKLVLDWHNYGYTILQMSLGQSSQAELRHPLVKVAHAIEAFFGPKVHAAFCVSKAMKRDLYNKWNVEATVLYDRPLSTFKPCSVDEKHNLLMRLSDDYPILAGPKNTTCISELGSDGVAHLKTERPGLLVSSTSWTPDEDFGILFDALSLYESRCEQQQQSLPDLICIITGKGPLKEYYQELIDDQKWNHVQVIMPWLEPEDYPLMLGSADFGVCLHTSSSGIDLPMKVSQLFLIFYQGQIFSSNHECLETTKLEFVTYTPTMYCIFKHCFFKVVDMFGCGLPVAAKNFQALPELVKDGINGVLFDTSEELSERIVKWFEDFPTVSYERRRRPFANHIERFRAAGWPAHWRVVAQPIFQDLL